MRCANSVKSSFAVSPPRSLQALVKKGMDFVVKSWKLGEWTTLLKQVNPAEELASNLFKASVAGTMTREQTSSWMTVIISR